MREKAQHNDDERDTAMNFSYGSRNPSANDNGSRSGGRGMDFGLNDPSAGATMNHSQQQQQHSQQQQQQHPSSLSFFENDDNNNATNNNAHQHPQQPNNNNNAPSTISNLQEQLTAKDEQVFELQLALATVQAESSHQKQEGEQQISSLEQQVRRFQHEANLAQREIASLTRKLRERGAASVAPQPQPQPARAFPAPGKALDEHGSSINHNVNNRYQQQRREYSPPQRRQQQLQQDMDRKMRAQPPPPNVNSRQGRHHPSGIPMEIVQHHRHPDNDKRHHRHDDDTRNNNNPRDDNDDNDQILPEDDDDEDHPVVSPANFFPTNTNAANAELQLRWSPTTPREEGQRLAQRLVEWFGARGGGQPSSAKEDVDQDNDDNNHDNDEHDNALLGRLQWNSQLVHSMFPFVTTTTTAHHRHGNHSASHNYPNNNNSRPISERTVVAYLLDQLLECHDEEQEFTGSSTTTGSSSSTTPEARQLLQQQQQTKMSVTLEWLFQAIYWSQNPFGISRWLVEQRVVRPAATTADNTNNNNNNNNTTRMALRPPRRSALRFRIREDATAAAKSFQEQRREKIMAAYQSFQNRDGDWTRTTTSATAAAGQDDDNNNHRKRSLDGNRLATTRAADEQEDGEEKQPADDAMEEEPTDPFSRESISSACRLLSTLALCLEDATHTVHQPEQQTATEETEQQQLQQQQSSRRRIQLSIQALKVLQAVLEAAPVRPENASLDAVDESEWAAWTLPWLSDLGMGTPDSTAWPSISSPPPSTTSSLDQNRNNLLILLFQRAARLHVQAATSLLKNPGRGGGGAMAKRKWPHRVAALDDSVEEDLNDVSGMKDIFAGENQRHEAFAESLLPPHLFRNREHALSNERLLMDWMASVLRVWRRVWKNTSQDEQQRYRVWMTTNYRARCIVATVLDWIQMVLVPNHRCQHHELGVECVLFLSQFWQDGNLGYALLLTQMKARTLASSSAPFALSFSAVGVMSHLLSALVQRQYREYDEATIHNESKVELTQHQKNNKLLTLSQLNPLRHAIVRFFDGLLRLTQYKLFLLEKEQEEQQNTDSTRDDSIPLPGSAFSGDATFWRATSEHQDIYKSAVALLLNFPDERNGDTLLDLQDKENVDNQQSTDDGGGDNGNKDKKDDNDDDDDNAYYPHAVPAAIKAMLRLQIEELELDEEDMYAPTTPK